MKTPAAVRHCLAWSTLLLPLLLLTGCKQSDTLAQTQPPDTAARKATGEMAERPPAPVTAAKPPLTPAVAAPQQKTAAPLPATTAEAEPTAVEAPAPKKPRTALPTFGPDDPRSGIYLSITGKMARMGDPSDVASDAYRYGRGEHPKALAGVGLPKDKFGLIDWMAIVNEGIIKPRGSIKPGVPEMPPFDMDVLIKAKGDFVNDVLFPHKAHTYWLKCENCHTGIFIMAKGKNKMTMQGIVEGKWCGRCHGKVAFPLTDCNRCHQTPKQTVEVTAEK